jgi:acetyl-CoA carboxylase biotin carboxylase subunit
MRRALDEYFVGGIKTNLPLFRRILEHPDFVQARIDTGFLDRLLASRPASQPAPDSLSEIAALSAALFAASAPKANGKGAGNDRHSSAWKRIARLEGVRSE